MNLLKRRKKRPASILDHFITSYQLLWSRAIIRGESQNVTCAYFCM